MQIVVDDGSGERELVVIINHPEASVGDLEEALTGQRRDSEGGLMIGETWSSSHQRLTDVGLHEGALVRLRPAPPAQDSRGPGVVRVGVVGGIRAGGEADLSPGETTVGRSETNSLVLPDFTVSRRHCELTVTADGAVTVTDLSSTGGTWVDGQVIAKPTGLQLPAVVEIGSTQIAIQQPVAQDRPLTLDPGLHVGAAGTRPFNRPPRSASPRELDALTVPAEPSTHTRPVFNLAAILGPVLFAGTMLAVAGAGHTAGSPMRLFALFGLLSPLMVLGNWYEGHYRGKRSLRRDGRRYASELAAFTEALIGHRDEETRRRREELPDAAEVLRRAVTPSVHLWERRRKHPDFLRLSAGLGDLPWKPALTVEGGPAPEGVNRLLTANRQIRLVPIPVDLAGGGVVGIVGEREAALAVARSLLCQAVTHHGPADVVVTVVVGEERADDWDWAKWMPHARNLEGRAASRRLADSRDDASSTFLSAMLQSSRKRDDEGAVLLLVVDGERLIEKRNAPALMVLRGATGPAAGIILAASRDRLPADCTTVVQLEGPHGDARLERPQAGEHVESFLATGMDAATARRCARALARFEDPELEVVGAGLPDEVSLVPLLDLAGLQPDLIRARWASREEPGAATPIGLSEDGVLDIDLVADGPHALVGGTTGSGKSELLRSLVAGLAAGYGPEHVNFGLFDFKGGSTFDDFERLPHTVGIVTDLEPATAQRALRCLKAELQYRERLFRDVGVSDLPEYARALRALKAEAMRDRLPRLVVVIDEFATMADKIPDAMDTLVDVAQRGRALGVHLVLATQKPAKVVNDNIRSNTRLRIALRVEDASDSTEVIDIPAADAIVQPGRAYFRFGKGEVLAVQTARATVTTEGGSVAPVEVAPFVFTPRLPPEEAPRPEGTTPPRTDLVRLIDAIRAAAYDRPAPRKPWPDPLPSVVNLRRLCGGFGQMHESVLFALADDPEAQAQYPVGWDLDAGNLLIYGIGGAGTTTALASIGVALGVGRGPEELHLYVVDLGAGDLEALGQLPHTGAFISASEHERQMRLVRFMREQVDRRKAALGGARGSSPRLVLLLDNYAAFASEFDDLVGMEVLDELARVYAEGPEVGVHMAIASDRPGAIPGTFASLTRQKLILRLAETADFANFGVPQRLVPPLPPGRGLLGETAQVVHVGWPSPSLREAVTEIRRHWVDPLHQPAPILALPTTLDADDIVDAAQVTGTDWFLPLGIRGGRSSPAGLHMYEAEHALIAGPARSGRSSALRTLAWVLRRTRPDACLLGVAPRRSALRQCPDLDLVATGAEDIADLLAHANSTRPVVVFVDDAEFVDDPDGAIAALISLRRPDVHVIASGQPDVLGSLYGHWTQVVRRCKLGLLLKPNVDLDGDLLGAVLPRRSRIAITAGRGYLVNNSDVELIQVAQVRKEEVVRSMNSGGVDRASGW